MKPNETMRRLTAIKKRKRDADKVLSDQKTADQEEAAQKAQKRTDAINKWEHDYAEVVSIIAAINRTLADVGLQFHQEARSSQLSDSIMSSYTLKLFNNEADTHKAVHFNMRDASLMTEIAFLMPHSGKAPAQFSAESATRETYEEIILDFLDQAIPPLKGHRASNP